MESISDRLLVIDGFLIHKREDGTKKILDPSFVVSRLKKQESKAIRAMSLRDMALIRNSSTDLIPVVSPLLFEVMPTEERNFYVDDGVMKVVKAGRTKKEDIESSEKIQVIAIRFQHNVGKFLYLNESVVPDLPEATLPAPRFSRDRDDVFQMMGVEPLRFRTNEDYATLARFSANKDLYVSESTALLHYCYQKVMSVNTGTLASNSMFDAEDEFPFLPRLNRATVEKYGKTIAPLYFILANIDELPAVRDIKHDLKPELLKPTLENRTLVEDKAQHLCNVFREMLSKNSISGLFHLLVRMLPYNLSSYTGSSEKLKLDAPKVLFEKLSTFAAWVKYTLYFNSGEDANMLILRAEGSHPWGELNTILRKLDQCIKNEERDSIEYVPPDGILVDGKLFNRTYIRNFYRQVRREFEANWQNINRVYRMTGVETAGKMLLDDPTISLAEDQHSPFSSIKQVFPRDSCRSQLPMKRGVVTSIDETAVLEAIDNMTVLLMWLIWFSVGTPYRFPELQTLAFAGRERNVFVDDKTRTIKLVHDSEKKRKPGRIVKWLDKGTSYCILYFILVLRPLQVTLLGPNYSAFKPPSEEDWDTESIWAHIKDGREKDRVELSQIIMAQYLFLDVSRGSPISYARFSLLYEKFPTNITDNKLNFQQLRQGMLAIMRKYVDDNPGDHDAIRVAACELLAGNSVRASMNLYGVDDFSFERMSRSAAHDLQRTISEQYIRWAGLYEQRIVQRKEPGVSIGSKSCFVPELLLAKDLKIAGWHLYGDRFQFKNSDQFEACVEVYMSSQRIFAIQAPTGFGKTLLYQLPLICLAQRNESVVSFVFVPNVTLLAGTTCRLRQGLLVGNIKSLMDDEPQGNYNFLDVYVGTYEELSSDFFKGLVNNWKTRLPNSHLGMLVIEEFQNLQRKKSVRESVLTYVKGIEFEEFWKIVLVTATGSHGSLEGSIQTLGLKGKLFSQSSLERHSKNDIYVMNFVREPCVSHIYKDFQILCDDGIEQVLHYTRQLVEVDSNSKVAIVTGERVPVEALFLAIKRQFHITYLHEGLKAEEVASRIKAYIEDEGGQVLLGAPNYLQGLDVENLRLVILLDHCLSISEYIQCVGRLRTHGVAITLGRTMNVERCITEEIAEYYDVPFQGHRGCCGNFDNVSGETKSIFVRLMQKNTRKRTVEELHHPDDPNGETSSMLEIGTTANIETPEIARALIKLYKGRKTIFEFLQFTEDQYNDLYISALDHRFFDNITLLPKDTGTQCVGCLEKCERCCCWFDDLGSKKVTLRTLAMEGLAFVHSVLPSEEYQREIVICRERGVPFWLIRFQKIAPEILYRHHSVYRDYHALVRQHITLTCDYLAQPIVDDYNRMWNFLYKKEILSYFNTGQTEECPSGGCNISCVSRAVERAAPWNTDFPITREYLQAQMEGTKENTSEYTSESNQPPNSILHYKLMQFGLFYNRRFREAVWCAFPELPQVGIFSHWLKLMAHRARFRSEELPLYILVAVMYFRSSPK